MAAKLQRKYSGGTIFAISTKENVPRNYIVIISETPVYS